MRREFDNVTLEVVFKYNPHYEKYELKTAYPVAGDGLMLQDDGSRIELPKHVERRPPDD